MSISSPQDAGPPPAAVAPGLRARKRERTRRTIARVALELFDRQGFHATTLAQIADAAEVSPRTVSAYFPAKEQLAFPDAAETFDTLSARLRDRPAGERTADALRDYIAAWLRAQEEDEPERRVRRRVVDADEGLLRYERHLMARAQEAIAESIARDLGTAPDELEPRMAAASAVAIFELLTRDVLPGDAGKTVDDQLRPVERALAFIDGGIRACRADAPTG
ncbi:MAG TPA: helix-turn-helix domain-containing protein [Solirubrobacteraceae bacterium]|nr:helix-turn-helix domain-containing protein [Solirubrobacteraceae bacterium]